MSFFKATFFAGDDMNSIFVSTQKVRHVSIMAVG